jgi:signal transduction histidine kinase
MTTLHRAVLFHNDRILEGVARQVTADFNQHFLKERLKHLAMVDDRVRLARELHDGVLQSLTAAALQLEALSRVIEQNPEGASKRLRDIEEMIADEQRDLRSWIETLKPASRTSMASNADLVAALEKLCRRVETQCGLHIHFIASNPAAVPRTLADEIYRLIQEALSNMARHAHAQTGRVEMDVLDARVRIVVADDGCGFPFHGRYDLAALIAHELGPVSLRERVDSLHGDLVLTSRPSGSRLEVTLPLYPPPAPRARAVSALRVTE